MRPNLDHVSQSDYFGSVYEPSEDTFLMEDCLLKDSDLLRRRRPMICVEVGPGTGYLTCVLKDVLLPTPPEGGPLFVCVERNPRAAEICKQTLERNGVEPSAVVQGDLLGPMRLRQTADVVVFNPPYVPTEDPAEMRGDGLSIAYAGGVDGAEVIMRFLPSVPDVLSPGGLLYLLVLEQNRPDRLRDELAALGIRSCFVGHRSAGYERLSVLRCSRAAPP